MKKILPLVALLSLPFNAFAQELPDPFTEDFDSPDADLSSWTTTSLGGTAKYGVNEGTLEILAPARSNASALIATHDDFEFDDFVVEADVLPDPATGKVPAMVSLLARSNGGKAYGLSIGHNHGSTVEIWDLGQGASETISKKSIPIPWEKPMRLVFKGVGPDLTAQVFDGPTLIGETKATNNRYKSGKVGVVQFHLRIHPGAVRTRFDNFKAYHPDHPPESEPSLVSYEITTGSSPMDGGSVSGGGAILNGTPTTLIATPAEGYRFDRWEGDGLTDPNSSTTGLTVNQSQSITARFVRIWMPAIEANDSEGGTVSEIAFVDHGSIVSIRAVAKEGYHFVRWEGDGIADETASETEVTVTSGLPIKAIFAKDVRSGTTISVNPVIDGLTIGFDKKPGGGLRIRWTGGGELQQLSDAFAMETVAVVGPFPSESDHGIFRIRDPWEGGRATEIYVPASYDETEPMPLILALHAKHPSPGYLANYWKLKSLADSKGFLLAHPRGVRKNSAGFLGWEIDDAFDDPSFIKGLIVAAQANLNIDPNRIFLYGHSNGGRIAYETAKRYGDSIAAIASLEGLPRVPYDLAGAEPVHVLHLHGTATSEQVDVPIAGGPVVVPGETVTVVGVDHLISSWGAVAGHDVIERDQEQTLDLQDNLSGIDTTITRMTGGSANASVEFWEIKNAIHYDPGHHDDFSEEVIDWLFAHPKAEKLSFQSSGLLIPCDEGECEEIRTLLDETPLAGGASQRRFFKEDAGMTNAFGAITSQYALDETLAEIPGLDQPVPVHSVGRMLIITEVGDETTWEMEATLLPTGKYTYTATMLRGQGEQEGAYVRVTGTALPIEVGFSYKSTGWWQPGRRD